MDRHDEASRADYEQLRRHLMGPRREHPVAHQHSRAPADPPAAPRLSVMEWLLAVGHVVARRVRGVPTSPMVRLHPKR